MVATDINDIVYSISGDDSASFNIDSSSGVITFKTAPDYETKTKYLFTATATDSIGNKKTQDITININDINDEKPIFTSSNAYSVKENESFSLTLISTDKDANSVVKYSITGGNAQVDESSGKVTFTQNFDYETAKTINLEASANDLVNTTKQNITITVLDVDENPPVFTSSATVNVNENLTEAITLVATDANTLTYSISGGDSASFNINGVSGIITFKVASDYETKKSYTFEAKASDGINITTQNITINILNLNDNSPTFTSNNSATVAINQTEAITLIASDEDNNNITYSISGGDSAKFNIDSTSGIISFKVAPSIAGSYTFVATANDGANSTTQNITINAIATTIISLCDIAQPNIVFPESEKEDSKFTHPWREGTKGAIDTSSFNFNGLAGIDKYKAIFSNGYFSASFDIATKKITKVNLVYDASVGTLKLTIADDITLASKFFTLGEVVNLALEAYDASGTLVDTSDKMSIKIGEEYLKIMPKLYFTKADANSVDVAWCDIQTLEHNLTYKNTLNNTYISKNIAETKANIAITNTNVLHSFSVAGIKNNENGRFSNVINVVPINDDGSTNLKISKVTFNQSVQIDMDNNTNNTPIIANKPGVLRVFVDMTGNLPIQKVKITLSGSSATNANLPSITQEAIVSNSSFDTSDSTNKPILFHLKDAIWLKEGNKFSITIDSGNEITETSEDDNRYPTSGEKLFGFENRYEMKVHLVPINTPSGNVAVPQALADGTRDYLQSMYPLSKVNVVIESPITSTKEDGSSLLVKLTIMKNADVLAGKTEGWAFYAGVFTPNPTFGFAGLGYVNDPNNLQKDTQLSSINKYPTSVSRYPKFYEIIAHEIGHNHGRRHVASTNNISFACLTPTGLDTSYPYNSTGSVYARIGKTGYSQYKKKLLAKNQNHDVMSYCNNQWISDYTYKGIYDFEKKLDEVHSRVISAMKTSSILIEGRVLYGKVSNNQWSIIDSQISKREDITNQTNKEFLLKVVLENGDIIEAPLLLVDLSVTDIKTFSVFIPSVENIKSIVAVNTLTNDTFVVQF